MKSDELNKERKPEWIKLPDEKCPYCGQDLWVTIQEGASVVCNDDLVYCTNCFQNGRMLITKGRLTSLNKLPNLPVEMVSLQRFNCKEPCPNCGEKTSILLPVEKDGRPYSGWQSCQNTITCEICGQTGTSKNLQILWNNKILLR